MGLRDDIQTLEARRDAGHDVGGKLAIAYAEMCIRKNSKRLGWYWFDKLEHLLDELDRHQELVEAGDGVEPANMGFWGAQGTVHTWLYQQLHAKEA